MSIADAAGAVARADINNALLALVSNSSGATEPATKFAYQTWADTTTGLLKVRNAANSAWIVVGELASFGLGLVHKLFATGGTGAAYTLTPTPAITALASGQQFLVSFTAAPSGTPTIAVSGLTAKLLKYKLYDGSKQTITATQVPAGWISAIVYDGTDFVVTTISQLNPAVIQPIGTIIDFAGTAAPSGFMVCPTAATNISRTTYAALFAVIGTTWGVGDGSTTFGMPWFPDDYASVQANANVGTNHVGEVISHNHTQNPHSHTQQTDGPQYAGAVTGVVGYQPGSSGGATGSTTATNNATGGASNRAAGVRVLKCVKY
jgi:microcystin-dependent protein